MGHGSARIARAAGVHPTTIRNLVRGDATHRQPSAARRDHRRLRRLVGQTRPRPHPLRARRGHRRPQTRHRRELVRRRRPRRRPARHPRLPARVRLETRHRHRHRPRHLPARTPRRQRKAHGRRRTLDLGLHPRGPRRHGTPRLPPQRQRAHRPGHRAHPRRGPHLRGHPGRSPRRLRRGAVIPADGTAAARPAGQDAVIVSAGEVKTLLAALDEAAEYKRDRAETCADCADQSCTTCQWRLQAADAYDQLAGQHDPSRRGIRRPGSAPPTTRRLPAAGPHAAADPEAGQ